METSQPGTRPVEGRKGCISNLRLDLWMEGRKLGELSRYIKWGWSHLCFHGYIYDPGSRFATTPPPPTWYGPKTCVLQHSTWKRCICSVFLHGGLLVRSATLQIRWILQPTFRKRVICNVSASTSWSSAAAPSSISVSNYHMILNLLPRVFSLGTGLISVYILCLSNFLLECLVFRNWSNLKFS